MMTRMCMTPSSKTVFFFWGKIRDSVDGTFLLVVAWIRGTGISLISMGVSCA